jgi:hypothetical protein
MRRQRCRSRSISIESSAAVPTAIGVPAQKALYRIHEPVTGRTMDIRRAVAPTRDEGNGRLAAWRSHHGSIADRQHAHILSRLILCYATAGPRRDRDIDYWLALFTVTPFRKPQDPGPSVEGIRSIRAQPYDPPPPPTASHRKRLSTHSAGALPATKSASLRNQRPHAFQIQRHPGHHLVGQPGVFETFIGIVEKSTT